VARTTRLNAKLAGKIFERIRAGNYPETAAVAEGVPQSTFWEWMKQGKAHRDDPRSVYGRFFLGVDRARAEAEADLVAEVRAGDTQDRKKAKAAAWLLERTRSKRFGAVIRHRVEDEIDRMLGVAEKVLDRDAFRKLCEGIAQLDQQDETGEPDRAMVDTTIQ
jgi:hypothetical protein